ncbi:hypothetical protein A0U92_15380 [Acetobacter aceti]|uniref:Uncharacterized protein n=2 Tax=Acetobacterales TaxID=3120395 RepID=A0A1U9KJJ8_ACEAC|nr:hypothetical protein A0U92_15380 [Acetobacter aceti]
MGTLWLGGINNPSTTQHVTLEIDGSDTDVGIFECVPSSGGAPTEIDFKGTNDSVSMYPGEALGNGGDTMDLSHTVFKQVDPTSGASAALQKLVIHGSGGNDTFTGAALNNFLYEGIGNCTFHQSAGNDVITCNGGNSTYYANNVWSAYAGGYLDQNGTSYLNNGEDWALYDQTDGQMVFLTNVLTVVLNGVTYLSSVENQAAAAWPGTTSAATSAQRSALSSGLASDAAASPTGALLSGADLKEIHASVLADFTLKSLQGSASVASIGSSQAATNEDYSSASAASVLSGIQNHTALVAFPSADSTTIFST